MLHSIIFAVVALQIDPNVIITLVISLLPFLFSIIRLMTERRLLPVQIQQFIARIGEDTIINCIEEAKRLRGYSNEARREWVIKELVGYLNAHNIEFPEGLLRIAVEYLYQKVYKGRLQ
jgi:hypothetical protein